MKLTRQHFELAKSSKGAWSRQQLQMLGIEWPLAQGWMKKIIGQDLDASVIQRFIDLKDAHLSASDIQNSSQHSLSLPKKKWKPKLPVVSLDEAIKRLGNDRVFAKITKGMSFKDETD